jgi:hypothetical protein
LHRMILLAQSGQKTAVEKLSRKPPRQYLSLLASPDHLSNTLTSSQAPTSSNILILSPCIAQPPLNQISQQTKAADKSDHALTYPSSNDSMLRKNINKMAFAPNELVGAAGYRYRFKELIQERSFLGRVWVATSENPCHVCCPTRKLKFLQIWTRSVYLERYS